MGKVLTAPLAIIRVNGVAVGKMKSIRVTENIQRVKVQGLGELIPDEVPPVSWAGTVTCDFYNIDFHQSQIPGVIQRAIPSGVAGSDVEAFVDNVLLQSSGVQLDIYKKVPKDITASFLEGKEVPYAIIHELFLDSEGFDISEGQASGRNQSFQYLKPIVYKKADLPLEEAPGQIR